MIMNAGVIPNNKCEFSKESVNFLNHIIDEIGVYPDPEKTEAVVHSFIHSFAIRFYAMFYNI